jgi:hypothetical protein
MKSSNSGIGDSLTRYFRSNEVALPEVGSLHVPDCKKVFWTWTTVFSVPVKQELEKDKSYSMQWS